MTATQTAPTEAGTATTAGARQHARAQEGTVVDAMPTVPSGSVDLVDAAGTVRDVVWAERVAGGNYTHRVLDRGMAVRLTDVAGDAVEGRPASVHLGRRRGHEWIAQHTAWASDPPFGFAITPGPGAGFSVSWRTGAPTTADIHFHHDWSTP